VTVHQLLEQSLNHPYTLKVIDVFKHPEQAESDQISATPTLIKIWPKPVRRIVGELNDAEKIRRLLSSSEF
jgi:KaiB domain.